MKSAWQLTMRILGCMKGNLLLLMTLGIIMDSSIASQIPTTTSPDIGKVLRAKAKTKRRKAKIQASQTGSDITEALTNLNETLETLGRDSFKREILSLHTTLGKVNYEETKQLFLHNV